MRLTTVFIIASLMQVSAAGFAQKVSLTKSNANLLTVLNELKQQSGYIFLYTDNVLKSANPVTVKMNQVDFKAALDEVFKNQPLGYTITDNAITIRAKEPSFLDKVIDVISNDRRDLIADIRGVVRNERGEPLEGITVMVKGAKNGTRTNAKGEFVLKGVKKGDVLVFTGVAIEPFEYTVKDDKDIELNLKARLVQLEEVSINTGYQKISKERYVGSYSQLDSAAFHRRAGMGILERLDGTVTGVLFNKKGNNTAPIQIRGLSTLTDAYSYPLIIVDNFPYNLDLNTINPNDVESIAVLKDAAATSIWGARAGNGVIVITTKKAKFNQPLNVSWNSNVNIQAKPDLYYYPRVSSSDFIDFEEFLFTKGAYEAKLNSFMAIEVSPVVDILNKIKTGKMSEAEGKMQIDQYRNVDYRDQLNRYVYQQQIAQQHYLNLSGGSGIMNYQISAGYNLTRPGIQHSKNDERYTIASNAGFKAGKKIDIAIGFNLNQSNQRSVPLPQFQGYTYTKLADENGKALPVVKDYRLSFLDTIGRGGLLDWHFRPLDEIRLTDRNALARTATVNANVNYTIKPWLRVGLFGNYTISNGEDKNLNSLDTYFTRDLINSFTNLKFSDPLLRYPIPMGGVLDVANSKSNQYNLRANININKKWNHHLFSMMLAADLGETRSGGAPSTRFYGFQPDFGGYSTAIDYFDNYSTIFGTSTKLPNGDRYSEQTSQRFVSLTSNASYSYKEKYTLYASARRDGSNVFGVNTNNRWKPLWSAGTKWQLDKEKFFRIPWVDQLSLRATYGYLGNVNNSVNGLLSIAYNARPDSFSGLTSAYRNDPPNPNLRWEEVRIFDAGIDFGMFKNRLNGSFSLYRKKVVDLITNLPFAVSTGVAFQTVNGASLKGGGWDLNVGVKILDADLKWTLNYGLSHAKMKVTEIYQPNLYRAADFLDMGINPAVGRIAYGFSSYRWAGLDPLTGDPRGYLKGEISKDYVAIQQDSVDNQVFHGSSNPLYFGFVSNTISFRNLSLSFNISQKYGFYFRRPALATASLSAPRVLPADYYSRWQKPGDENITNVPSFVYPSVVPGREDFYAKSEVNVYEGDHIRLQDIRLQYDARNIFSGKFPVKNLSASFYLNNVNLILWRKNKSGLDPDFVASDGLSTPSPKTFTIGLSASF